MYTCNEPRKSISYKTACALSEEADQPAYPHHNVRCLPEEALDRWLLNECHVKTDQSARMQSSRTCCALADVYLHLV